MHKPRSSSATINNNACSKDSSSSSSIRRKLSFFSPMSVTPLEITPPYHHQNLVDNVEQDDVDDNAASFYAEKLLPNGDFYSGEWLAGVPHGSGKYLWTDGCMYEGQWRHGNTAGHGRFSWPSGATYEGDFKSGFMHGQGTYTGADGDTYRGSWSMNLKHGSGEKYFANSDYYNGEWRSGLQHGQGRYVWRNGNEYNGSWCDGKIHGRGTLVWANGNRYDGGWEDGMPSGSGSFRWADGSLYIGFWSREPASPLKKKGVYYASPAASSPTARDPRDMFSEALDDCKVCVGENVSILPSQKIVKYNCSDDPRLTRRVSLNDNGSNNQGKKRSNGRNNKTTIGTGGGADDRGFDKICIWESDGENNDITCDIVDGNEVVMKREKSIGERKAEEFEPTRILRSPPHMKWPPKEPKKQGVTISKGHKNYELMLNLQLGIRHAVGKQQNAGNASLDLKASAFDPKERVWTRFPPEGSKHTPPHQSAEFKWKDYCPVVFRTLRRLFKIDAGEYMMSICGNDALRELSSPGKSGSFFYLTNDDKYMIKTVKKSEVKVLLRMLPAYYNHVRAFENTLVTKFFGLHCVKLTGAIQRKVRFVVMGNLFCSDYPIHRRFDLKGSSHGRLTDKPEEEIDANTTLKDLDLNFVFRLQKSWFQEFRRQVDRDCEFLEQERIMDYSLLVGIHFREACSATDPPLCGDPDSDGVLEAAPRLSIADMDEFLCNPIRWASIRLGVNMPGRVESTIRRSDCEVQLVGDPTGEFYDVVLYFGIIDILQDYDISKKLEHAYKSMQYDPTSISAVDPKQYSKRFRDFICKVFMEDT